MEHEDIVVGERYEIVEGKATNAWLLQYAHEGLKVGQIVKVKEIRGEHNVGISVNNIDSGRAHGINAEMLKEVYSPLRGAEDF